MRLLAVQAACDTIRARMAEHLAGLYQARASEVRFAEGQVQVGGETLGFAEAAKLCDNVDVEKVAEVHSLLTALTKQQSADAAGVSGASATESAPGLDRHG